MYTQEIQSRAQELRAEGMPVRAISTALNVSKSVVHLWTRPPTTPKDKPVPHHDHDILRRALELRIQGQTVREIAKTLGIPEPSIYRWIAEYRDRALKMLDRCQEDALRIASQLATTDPEVVTQELGLLARRLERAKIGLTL